MDNALATALIGGGTTLATLVGVELAKRWRTRSDQKAAAATIRATDADADGRTSEALGTAFRTITESLTIIHDLRDRLGKVENDLIAARTEIESLQRSNSTLTTDKVALQSALDVALQDKTSSHRCLSLARADIRKLKSVIRAHPSLTLPKLLLDQDEA